MKQITVILAALSISLLGLGGCGSGGGSTSRLQQKTATITFSTVSGAHIDPLMGIQLSAKLPAGTGIKDVTTALTGKNNTGKLFSSTYVSSTQTVSFIMASTSKPIEFGAFAELKCDITPGFTFDQSSFEAINSPFPDLQMASGSVPQTEDLTTRIPVRMSVSFGY